MSLVAGHEPARIRITAERDHFSLELEGTECNEEGRDPNDERKHLQKGSENLTIVHLVIQSKFSFHSTVKKSKAHRKYELPVDDEPSIDEVVKSRGKGEGQALDLQVCKET
jgi:hypothetical protein